MKLMKLTPGRMAVLFSLAAMAVVSYVFGLPAGSTEMLVMLGTAGTVDLSEFKSLIEDQGKTWKEYVKTNDDRLDRLEKGLSTADHDAKLAKMDARLTEIANEAKAAILRAQRDLPRESADTASEVKSFGGALTAHSLRLGRAQPTPLDAELYKAYKSTFRTYLRKGVDDMAPEERKAINVGNDPQGGYLVDSEMDAAIDRVAVKASAMRSVARIVTIGSASWKKLVKTSGVGAGGWGGETTAPSETSTQGWSEIEITPGMVWAEPRASSQSLEDSVLDLEADLIEEIGITFADQEAQAFVDGNGVQRPRGILAYPMVDNASYSWGSVGFIKTGGAAGFASSNPSDALVDLQHSLKRSYRSGAAFMMNDATLAAVRKFKDGQGIYLWAPSGLQQGIVGQLLGHAVVTDDYMPDLGANAFPILFGDFRRSYAIVDRRGTTILRDPYTAKPWVKFYATRRVSAGIVNFEAVKALRCAA
jgi:HK97 family phage major capsid protein